MSEIFSEDHVTTILLICGENIDANLISQKLGFSSSTFSRKGEVIVPLPEDGATRSYDNRFNLDCWRRTLTKNQGTEDLKEQLELWIQLLYPVRLAFREFNSLGYWSVIDCQIASSNLQIPSIQFRLTKEMQLKLSQLDLDLDFTIYM
ncbi:MAG: DUF4279 domain-containing protein [Myxacorys californica WJT36-NPBG1]|jgi:hypothetical protein|nr:DUF4279 domain-containing protein [Myxacorys californica WJT36-NPBG1]